MQDKVDRQEEAIKHYGGMGGWIEFIMYEAARTHGIYTSPRIFIKSETFAAVEACAAQGNVSQEYRRLIDGLKAKYLLACASGVSRVML